MRAWIRDRGLGIFFCSVFLVTWVGQLVFEWLEFVNEAADHGQKAVVLVGALLGRLLAVHAGELAVRVPPAVGVHDRGGVPRLQGLERVPGRGERLEAKLDVLLARQGLDPKEIEETLPAKHRKTR